MRTPLSKPCRQHRSKGEPFAKYLTETGWKVDHSHFILSSRHQRSMSSEDHVARPGIKLFSNEGAT
jgi:hypothetical protein